MIPVDRALGSSYYALIATADNGKSVVMVNTNPYLGSGGGAKWISFLEDGQIGFSCLTYSAGTYGSLYRTEDGGRTFEQIEYPSAKVKLSDGTYYNPFVVPERVYEEDGKLYMEVGQGADGDYYGEEGFCNGLYESEDKGRTWEYVKESSCREVGARGSGCIKVGRKTEKIMKTIRVAAAVIRSVNEAGEPVIFATQRGYGEFKDGWEFPGGKIEEGETPEQALKREIMEELDTEIIVGELLERVEYDYPAFHLSMDCFWCEIGKGNLVLKEHEDARWLTREQLRDVEWLSADVALVERIAEGMIYLG